MKLNDSNYILKSILESPIRTITKSEKLILTKIANDFKFKGTKTKPFEEPDLLIICKNTIYAIEHFTVDNSANTRKGSSYKKKYNNLFI